MPVVTALYAGILGLMSIALAFIPGGMRGRLDISVGDGGNPDLLLAMRRHANFAEHVPLTVIMIGLLELNGAPALAIHVLGGGLVVFRICHALGLKPDTVQGLARTVGAGGSALVMVVSAVWAIVLFF